MAPVAYVAEDGLVRHQWKERYDRILALDDGELAGVGTHKELLENCELYQEIYYSQYPKEAGGSAK